MKWQHPLSCPQAVEGLLSSFPKLIPAGTAQRYTKLQVRRAFIYCLLESQEKGRRNFNSTDEA